MTKEESKGLRVSIAALVFLAVLLLLTVPKMVSLEAMMQNITKLTACKQYTISIVFIFHVGWYCIWQSHRCCKTGADVARFCKKVWSV